MEERHIERLFAVQELKGAYIKSIELRYATLPTKLSCLLNKLPNLTSIVLYNILAMKETTEDNSVLNLKKLRSLHVSGKDSKILEVFNYLPRDVLQKVYLLGAKDPFLPQAIILFAEHLVHDEKSFLYNQRSLEEMTFRLKKPANGIDNEFCLLSKFQKLRSLDIYLSDPNNDLYCFKTIFLPNLTTLTLRGAVNLNNFPISTMKALQQGLPKLENFVFTCCPRNFLNTILAQFQGLKSLEFFSWFDATEYIFQEGLAHENLKSLVVGENDGELLKLLSACKNLNYLELKTYKGIVNETMIEEILKHLSSLTSLKITYTSLTSALWDIIKTHGKNLNYFSSRCKCEKIITVEPIREKLGHQFKIIEFSYSSGMLQMKN